MVHLHSSIKPNHTYRWLDHTDVDTIYETPNTALASFAIDDALATAVSKGASPAAARLWAHDNTIVLGIPDARLPNISAGVKHLNEHGFQVIVRNSGGLAVALDDGVLNISLVLPDAKHVSIDDGYHMMVKVVKNMFADVTDAIEAYEIVGSYCPGDYDLSIQGRKFSGISQRRIRNAVAVQIYLDIFGDSLKRAALIRDFYNIALSDAPTTFTYPAIDPRVMASLNELLNIHLTIADVKKRAEDTLSQMGTVTTLQQNNAFERQIFEKRYAQMCQRNADILAMQD
ncbi:lipoate--protein ligase family protein [Lentibacillus saliphilus]|uniref:lipoate--protein ligase family protein n=1 Tax=Lentibacillus saliphilus TaxID=2737028 RepID=UPI001C2FE861|nr:lipoate--protein ligase family protein [Lentibacillus saliphilus]